MPKIGGWFVLFFFFFSSVGKFRPGIIYISWSEIGGCFTGGVKSFRGSSLFLQNVNIATERVCFNALLTQTDVLMALC